MTVEQYKEAEKIMSEIREIESFLKVFEEGHRISIVAYERAAASLDCDKERSFQVRAKGYLFLAIADSMKGRIKELNSLLEEI